MPNPFAKWINQENIRDIMNIPTDVKAWELCSDDLEYIVDINATLWIYPILKEKYRILVYSGTTDGAVPTLGTKQWINNLGWKITDPWRPYFVQGQLAGHIERREKNFAFATVHGTGHMAPQWKREETYTMIFGWLFDREF